MSRKGSYIGGSTLIYVRQKKADVTAFDTDKPISLAVPRSGGAPIKLIKSRSPSQHRLTQQSFKKFNRRMNEVASWLPYLDSEYAQIARLLARVHRRLIEISALEYNNELAAEASVLHAKFLNLIKRLSGSATAKAKFEQRSAKRLRD